MKMIRKEYTLVLTIVLALVFTPFTNIAYAAGKDTEPEPEPNPNPNPNPQPLEIQAAISLSNITGTAPATFQFVAKVVGGTEPYRYSWDFDEDGIEDADEDVAEHTYEETGEYEVGLIVIDAENQTAMATMDVTVVDPPVIIPDPDPDPDPEPGQDVFGINMLYPTAPGGPVWRILEIEDPTDDGFFYYGMFAGTTIDYLGGGTWQVDAQSGTPEHGIRMHVDSPSGTWKNTEMTGYFFNHEGDDQFSMIARHGPSYHDDGGCLAYGYYGMTAVDGNVFFKKKLYHFGGGYTQRLAQVNAFEDLDNRWIGIKFVVYDLPDNGGIKLELWADEGNMTNNWEKVTELVDRGGFPVLGGDDCDKDATDTIDEGTRATFRTDDTLFDYKKLSVREIVVPS
jgi:PKD repeat protein